MGWKRLDYSGRRLRRDMMARPYSRQNRALLPLHDSVVARAKGFAAFVFQITTTVVGAFR